MAVDATGHHLPGMANPAPNVTACVPFNRAPIAEKPVGYFILKNSWGAGFGEGGYAKLLYGNNCMRGVTQPYICPGKSCPPPPPPSPKPKIATLADCVTKASKCQNANFVSFSPKQHDCAWYQHCTFTPAALRKYAGNGTDYQSQVLLAVAGGPPAGTTAVGCCGDLYECTRSPPPSEGVCNKDPRGAWNTYGNGTRVDSAAALR